MEKLWQGLRQWTSSFLCVLSIYTMDDLVLHDVLRSRTLEENSPETRHGEEGRAPGLLSSWPFRENKCETSVAQVPTTYLRSVPCHV